MSRDRAALVAGTDPSVVASWITELQAEHTRHQIVLRPSDGRPRMTRTQIALVARQLREVTRVLRQAAPSHRADVYAELSLTLAYDRRDASSSPKRARSNHVAANVSAGRLDHYVHALHLQGRLVVA